MRASHVLCPNGAPKLYTVVYKRRTENKLGPGMSTPTVRQLLSESTEKFIVETIGGVYEHSPWIVEKFLAESSYSTITTVSELASSLQKVVDDASVDQKIALLKAHPDLCEKVEKAKELTDDSQEEQGRSGLQSLTDDELASFTKNNEAYKSRFDFPFILAVRNATKYTVLGALANRVKNTRQAEIVTALQQVHKIAWMRLLSKLDTSDAKGFLTCHVLDTANGIPGTMDSLVFVTTSHKIHPLASF